MNKLMTILSTVKCPSYCPHCHKVINPELKWRSDTIDDLKGEPQIIAIFQCPSPSCLELIVTLQKKNDQDHKLNFDSFLTGSIKGPEWPIPIKKLQGYVKDENGKELPSKFIEIYLQSLTAEQKGLDEIAGMGFRKAIEFLVKDLAIQDNPDDVEDIKKAFLGNVINKYFKGDLKALLERSAWLGNDQAHYTKLFEEFDIQTLKGLINAIATEINREYTTKEYIKSIEKKNSQILT